MIRNQFPDIGGLYCPGKNVEFPETKSDRWLQIINAQTNHWVLIAKGFLSCEEVMIFDSLTFEPSKREHVIACICSLVRTEQSTITYLVRSCQRQGNGFDCGVFAIAFAVTLAYGDDPSHLVYDPVKLRGHLKACFISKTITPFPSTVS